MIRIAAYLCTVLLTTSTAFGQKIDIPQPFETLRFAGGMHAVPYSRGLQAWEPSPGAVLSVSTPFASGEVEVGAAINKWSASHDVLPDFYSALFFGGWSLSTSPNNPVKLSAGFRIGNFFMAFDSEQVSGERNESEFALSPFLRIRRTLLPGIEGHVETSATHVYTNPGVDFAQFSAGISFIIDSPTWFKEVFQ